MKRSLLGLLLTSLLACGVESATSREEINAPDRDERDPGGLQPPNGSSTPGGEPGSTPTPAAPLPADFDDSKLDPFFAEKMKAAKVPGMAAAVVKGGTVRWSHGYGLADIASTRPVTADTLFMLASVSKPVNATALLTLIADPARNLKLDDAIDPQLPFTVRNPRFPTVPITFRMLLTHTSSLIDGFDYGNETVPGDSPTPLSTWVQAYVRRSTNWSASRPGTRWSYSNSATALAGLLVERISGMNLQEYCTKAVFEPLAMKESSWFLKGLDPTHIALPYNEDTNGGFITNGHHGYPDYPDGQLRTSAPQLGRFVAMVLQKGELDGKRVLPAASAEEMQKVQLPNVDTAQALSLYYDSIDGTKVLGHNGADTGVSTDMWIDPAKNVGFVLLTNGTLYLDENPPQAEVDAMLEMNKKLLQLAHTL